MTELANNTSETPKERKQCSALRPAISARRLLRLKPASEYLSISTAQLRRLVQSAALPVIRLEENGHAPWLLDIRDLDAWIERTKRSLE